MPEEETDDLLVLNQRITIIADLLRRAKRRQRLGYAALALSPILLSCAAACWFFVPPGKRLSLAVVLIAAGAALAGYGVYVRVRPGVLVTRNEAKLCDWWSAGQRPATSEIELTLALVRQEKANHPKVKNLDTNENRTIHKEEILLYVEELRHQARRNRRLNHIMQVTTIVGSLGATGLTSLSFAFGYVRIASLTINFIVGVASGVAGYFKYKDRGFYAQQTADAIEQEWHALNLGIGRYKDKSKNDSMTLFSEEVHRLRTEQKNREQNLDQPSRRNAEAE